jgi:hypothetical protein
MKVDYKMHRKIKLSRPGKKMIDMEPAALSIVIRYHRFGKKDHWIEIVQSMKIHTPN